MVVLKLELERRGFKHPLRSLAGVTMFDCYYCKVILSLENFGKMLRKVHFCITIMVHKSMKDS